MSVYAGKDAYINGVPCVENWTANEAVAAQQYAASCVPGGTAVPAGIVNWTGTIGGYGAFPSAVLPGTAIASFQGVINNTSSFLKSLIGAILIEQLTIDIDKSTYAPIKWAATWGAQGVLTEAASGAADSTVSEAPNGKDLKINVAASDLTQSLTKAQIVLKRPHSTYVDAGATYRNAGNLEANINFGVQDSSLLVAAYAKNVLALTKIYTTATAFWEFSKIRFLGKSGLTLNRASNAITAYTVNGQWSGVEGSTLGYISYYNGSAYEAAVFGTNPS